MRQAKGRFNMSYDEYQHEMKRVKRLYTMHTGMDIVQPDSTNPDWLLYDTMVDIAVDGEATHKWLYDRMEHIVRKERETFLQGGIPWKRRCTVHPASTSRRGSSKTYRTVSKRATRRTAVTRSRC